jgi:monothiol glutaredoxin
MQLTKRLNVFVCLTKLMLEKPVVLFMKGTPDAPQCGFSRATIQVLGVQGVDPQKFASYNVLEDDELRSGIKEYSDWPTIPQLYVNGEFVGGCDIVMGMHKSGELEQLLDTAGALVPIEEAEPEVEAETSPPNSHGNEASTGKTGTEK